MIKSSIPVYNPRLIKERNCPLGWPHFFNVSSLFVILLISRFGFKGGFWGLIAPLPLHCLPVTFTKFERRCVVTASV